MMSENYLGYALISLNTAPTPKNLFLMIIEKHIWIIWNSSYKSSSNSPSIQVLGQQIGGGGSRLALIMLTQGEFGVQNQKKLADVILERSLRLEFAKKQICIEFMCAWVTHAHMRVGDPRAQNIDVCVCSLCAWVTHAHVRVGESRARILYTKMRPDPPSQHP